MGYLLTYKIDNISTPVLQVGKVWLREIKQLGHSGGADKEKSKEPFDADTSVLTTIVFKIRVGGTPWDVKSGPNSG